MNLKRILFIIMCVLLALTIILTAVVISRVSGMLQGGKPSVTVTEGNTGDPTGEAPTGDAQQPTGGEAPTGETPTEGNHEHNMVKYSVNYPGCTQYGWTVFKCSCGKTSTGEFKDPLGHSYGTGTTVAATCTEGGYTSYTCSRCSHVDDNFNRTQPLGHDFTIVMEEVDATCTENSYIIRRCSHSGCKETQKEILPETATGHDWVESENDRTEPTCTETGKKVFACGADGCTATKEEVTPALGHDLGDWTTGSEGQASCTRPDCGITVTESQLKILKTSHSNDGSCTHYIIEVGTDETGCLYTYEVVNYLTDEPTFTYENGVGLKVTYSEGEETLALHTNGQLTIEDVETETTPSEEGSESSIES